jgi:hypothetical protein
MDDHVIFPVPSSKDLPRFDDVLKDMAPYPYTLDIFKSYLTRNHCSEFLEFIMDLREYSEKYKSAYGQDGPHYTQCDEAKHLVVLWRGLVSDYISPGASRELNLSHEEREELLQYMDGIIPPPPSIIEEVVKRVRESFQSSIFLLFLNSQSQATKVDGADSVPATIVTGISTPSSRCYPLAHFSVNVSLDASKRGRVEASNNLARQMDGHTTTEMATPTLLSALSGLKPPFAPNSEVIKSWKSGAKMAIRRIFHQ